MKTILIIIYNKIPYHKSEDYKISAAKYYLKTKY